MARLREWLGAGLLGALYLVSAPVGWFLSTAADPLRLRPDRGASYWRRRARRGGTLDEARSGH